ncbi:MAG: amino-acid N-acetyltransferase [Vicinamibacteria bacterium]|jgi:amino-acid N-acetyltransferase|nr:amino-acid N-acetyltransferase [Vicinamibacteria bacterium]
MRPTDLRGILRYVPQFREKTFVVAIDGAIVTDENFVNILMDIAVLWSLNIRTVLIHGASAQIQALASGQGSAPSDLEGSGVTDADTLAWALNASNRLTHEILEGLNAADLRGATTNAVIAHPLGILHGVDHLFTGRIERIDVELLSTLLSHGIVPVMPPLGMDGEGRTFRVNSDAVALEVAKALGAIKLVYITTFDGLYVSGQLARQMIVAELEEALQKQTLAPAQVSKAQHAMAACKAGVQRVHIINGRVDDGLLAEVFSNEGIGTLVYANEYQQIRKARKKDARSIEQLIRGSIESEELAPRSRAAIEKQIDDYFLFEVDRNPVACVALHVFPEQNAGELACLCVRPSHENLGIGRKMIQFIESRAREMNLNPLLALSTQAFSYFQSKAGFAEGSPDDLPPARREKYEQSGRRSKVLIKRLTPPAAQSA